MPKTKEEIALYHYQPETGEYLGSSIASLDPIDKEPLVPAHATIIPTPNAELEKNDAYAFNGVVWKKIDDYRGQKFYTPNGDEVEIKSIGEAPKTDWSKNKPEPPKPSDAEILKGIKAEAAKRIRESGHDWMAIRQVTTDKPVPKSIIKYAENIRKASNKLEKTLPEDFADNKYWAEVV